MHLSPAESHRVIDMVDCLTSFVEIFEKSPAGTPGRFLPSGPLDDRAAFDNMAYAARFPDVIERCIKTFKKELTPAEHNLLRSWEGNLLHDRFALLGYSGNGNALLSSEFGVVEVVGLTQEIVEVAPEAPSFVETVLLPCGNRITYAVSMLSFNLALGPGIRDIFESELASVHSGEAAIIATPGEFAARMATYRQEQQEREFEKIAKGAERDLRAARGKSTLPPGMHRGKLADIAETERDQLVDEKLKGEFQEAVGNLTLELAKTRAIHRKPRRKVSTALGDLPREELEDVAFRMGLDDTVPTKQELIDDIADAALDLMKLRQFLMFCSDSAFAFFCELCAAKGRISFDETQKDDLRNAQPMPPFSFLYYDEEARRFAGVVYPEILEMATLEEQGVAAVNRPSIAAMVTAAEWAANLYGLLPVEEYLDISRTLGEKGGNFPDSERKLSPEERQAEIEAIASILDTTLLYEDRDFRLESLDDTEYVVDAFLSIGEAVDYQDRKPPKGLIDYWQLLLDRHKTIERRPIEPKMLDTNFYDWVMERESAVLLRQWLDAHVPDDKDDLYFADKLVEEIVFATRGPVDPTLVPKLLLEAYSGVFPEEDGESGEANASILDAEWLEDLLALAMRFVNDIPIWDDNGHSPNELRDREQGHKTFYREDGRPMKVGRNDPCPCGSGKKYEKCCGR